MPLVILCLIVVVCGLLLLYYQLGPKVSRRIGDGFNGFGVGGGTEENGEQSSDNADGFANGDSMTDTKLKNAQGEKKDDDKVMFVYGGGEREERPLDTEDESDK